jgi:arylsulfatase A-like enzyme
MRVQGTLCGFALTIAAACSPAGDPVARGMTVGCARGFNLVLITLDTTRADALGCYGARAASTPNLDALAARGIRFAQAITSVPLTAPSHSSILTGLYPPSHGVRNNGEQPLANEQTTLAEILHDHGYQTAAFVSAFVLDHRFGLDQGFDVYDDHVARTHAPNSFGGANERPGDATADLAQGWLARRDVSKPFFTWIHFYDAHEPYAPAAPFDAQFRGREYAGEIAFVDAQVGRLIAALDSAGLSQRTLIAVVADHGESLGEHGESTHGRTIYDAVMRVPWILACPAAPGAAGVVVDDVVATVDLAPTVLDALGIAVPKRLDGQSLVSTPSRDDRAVYIESMMTLLNNGWAPLHGLRSAHAKFIQAPRSEFFDLDLDPFELSDRTATQSAEAAKMAAQLNALLAAWPKDSELLKRSTARSLDAERALSALGYTSGASPDGSIGVLDPKDMLPGWELIEEAIRLEGQAVGADAPRKLAEALGKVQRALERSHFDRAALEQKARILTAQGHLDEAAKTLREYIAIQPSADAYVFLAQLALAREKPEDVEALVNAALALEPAHGGARIAQGDLYMKQGKFDEAIAAFDQALKLDPIRAQGMASARIENARTVRDASHH